MWRKILHNGGFKLLTLKCSFLRKEIKYLGHVIDQSGLHTNPEKIKEIGD